MTVTDGRSPGALDLVGHSTGWSVIDPASVLTRLWYFDGKFLRAEGFRRDQEYVRSLVALAGRAAGHGLVHGFTASRGTGDTIVVTAGLALTPSGRPLLLTGRQDLPIAELMARASGGAVGERSGRFTPEPEFGPCPPDAGEPPATGGPTPMWVLYARPVEALCGEEARFGELCEDACAAETDRSVVVEGVQFFVEQLNLTLPTSSAVIFAGRHLRSRYASAYYRWERARVASLISGAGLRSPIWCAGAEGVTGDAVALGVFDRAGGVTTFVDAWTARRELVETSPHRYWHWRMARRPRDVYLAQVLQFQCQLLHLPVDPAGPGTGCDDEREVLAAANEMLAELTDRFVTRPTPAPTSSTRTDPSFVDSDAYTRIAALQKHVAAVLAQGGAVTSGSLLLDGGIVELPPAGYLPVNPQRDVHREVRAFMGPGVDLRFCAVRPDFIGEAFDEAQHMERISLTQGIDDPGRLEEVDILVPDGKVTAAEGETSDAFQGTLIIRPQIKVGENRRATTGGALGLRAVGREHAGDRWSWTLAAVGDVPRSVALPNLLAAILIDFGVGADKVADGGVNVDEPVKVPFVGDEVHFERMSDPAFVQRLSRERHFAQARRARVNSSLDESDLSRVAAAVGPDRKLQRGEERPMAFWLDLEIASPLTALAPGRSTPATLRLSVYSRAKELPVLVDFRMVGSLTVTDIVTGSVSGPIHDSSTIVTSLSGQTDPLLVFGTQVIDAPPRAFHDLQLTWKVGTSTSGAKVLLAGLGRPISQGGRVQPTIEASDAGDPRHVEVLASLNLAGRSMVGTDWGAPAGPDATSTSYPIGRLDLDELPGGLDEASQARSVGEAAIEMIAAELALPGRDPSFAANARQRLLARDATAETQVHVAATTDWVFFHRRRTRICESGMSAPVAVRRYRLHHALITNADDLRRFRALDGVFARTADELPGFEAKRAAARVREESDLDYVHATLPVSGLGFKPVATLEFEASTSRMVTPTSVLRDAWRAADRGTHLLLAAAGDIGVGDGEDVVLGRLATVRSAVSGLIDQTPTQVRHLTAIPPEFQDPGLEGAMFVVGFSKPEIEIKGCVTLLRIDLDMLRSLRTVIDTDNLPKLTLDQILAAIEGFGVVPDTFEATFGDGAVLLDPAAVTHWWGPVPPGTGVALVDPSHTDAADLDLWRARTQAASSALGLSAPTDLQTVAGTGHCGAALILVSTGTGTGRTVLG